MTTLAQTISRNHFETRLKTSLSSEPLAMLMFEGCLTRNQYSNLRQSSLLEGVSNEKTDTIHASAERSFVKDSCSDMTI